MALLSYSSYDVRPPCVRDESGSVRERRRDVRLLTVFRSAASAPPANSLLRNDCNYLLLFDTALTPSRLPPLADNIHTMSWMSTVAPLAMSRSTTAVCPACAAHCSGESPF